MSLDDVELSGVTFTRDRVQHHLRGGVSVQRLADLAGWPRAHVIKAGFEIGLRLDAARDVMTTGAGLVPAAVPEPRRPMLAHVPPVTARAMSKLEQVRRLLHELGEELSRLDAALAGAGVSVPKRQHAAALPLSSERLAALAAQADLYRARLAAAGAPSAVIRQWAIANGVPCPVKARVPMVAIDAYIAAHGGVS